MATASRTASQSEFYREFLMGRPSFDPQDYGVDMPQDDFMDLMAEEFNLSQRGHWTLDEMLLHPREAQQFCDDVRRKHKFFGVPESIILRSVMIRRKNP